MSTEHLHSSALPRFAPIPKTVKGKTRADEKTERDKADDAAEQACYRLVDKRDRFRCRVTGVLLVMGGSLTKAIHRHHLIFRSQQGPHETWNVLTISRAVHDLIHVHGTLRLSGDADARDADGKLCGVKVEKLLDGVWVVARWV
jgi:5-methylcytosine-specific restriction endonuclease McrA